MPLRYGVSFPAWFNPTYPPIPPVQPKIPKQQFFENKEVFVTRFYIGGSSVPQLLEMLAHYNSEEYYINNSDSYENAIEVMKTEKYPVILDDKEFAKLQKEYARAIKDYERMEAEYQSRLKKYPSMLYMHEDAKLRETLVKAEDEYEDAQIRDSESQQILFELRETIKKTTEKLSDLQNRYKEKNLESEN